MDQLPGKHRVVFDTTTPDGFGEALFFANNFMSVNRSQYGLQNADLAVVVIARHRTTPFGYNDAMWAKYGAPIAARSVLDDPKTKRAPKMNLFNSSEHGALLTNRGATLDVVAKEGVHLAVCSISTRAYAGVIAATIGAKIDDIFSELTANLVANARMVPAGIVTVTRAQERGYSLVST